MRLGTRSFLARAAMPSAVGGGRGAEGRGGPRKGGRAPARGLLEGGRGEDGLVVGEVVGVGPVEMATEGRTVGVGLTGPPAGLRITCT